MHISKFQLRLTLIFLLVLLIPAIISIILTRFILGAEKVGVNMDKKVEAVLQEASQIAYDIIDSAKEEYQFIAEDIASGKKVPESLDKLKELIQARFPSENELFCAIISFADDLLEARITASTSPDEIPPALIEKINAEKTPISYQEGPIVYGVAPIMQNDKLMGAVVIYRQLEQELVKNIVDLQNLLSIYALRQDLGTFIWVGMIALVVVLAVVGAILAAILARSVTKPILGLVAGTREVANGNLDHRVEISYRRNRNDEIEILIESFNTMISQLKASRDQLMVAERLAAWRDIARRIAHEIKNPLTPIQLSMYRLRKNLGSEKYGEIFDQAYNSITNEVENLRNMVTEFSQFARMPKPRLQQSSPKDIVQDAIDLYTGLPENITLNTELADNLPQIMADKDQLRQVLHNLIGNAVDAMSEGGQLSIMAHLEPGNVVAIEIADTGCGMPDEVKQKIFTPYFTTKAKGTGLGMAITAQVIEEHSGEISIDSKEGIGTKIKIRFKGVQE